MLLLCYAVELSIAPAKLLNWNIDWLCMPAQLRWLKPMSSGNEKYLALPRILADPSCRRGHVPSRKVGSAHSIVFSPYMSRPCKHWKLNCQFTTYTLACGDSEWWNTIFPFCELSNTNLAFKTWCIQQTLRTSNVWASCTYCCARFTVMSDMVKLHAFLCLNLLFSFSFSCRPCVLFYCFSLFITFIAHLIC